MAAYMDETADSHPFRSRHVDDRRADKPGQQLRVGPTRIRWGDCGTCYFAGYVLEDTPALRSSIAKSSEILLANEDLEVIAISISGLALPGSDNELSEYPEEDIQALEELLEEAQFERSKGEGPLILDWDQLELCRRMSAAGARGEVLEVNRYVSPKLRLYEKYGYEEFISGSLDALQPAKEDRRGVPA